jgi:hypothetical protein
MSHTNAILAPAWRVPFLLAAALLTLWLPAPASAQDQGEMLSVQRDQNRIGLRLSSLREKMGRLVERYEAEGRTRNAELLRAAIAEFDSTDLIERSREIDRGLESTMLSTVGKQDTLVTALEGIYSVLRDRRDVDELREQADLLSEGINELDRLAAEERRLLQETLAASDTAAALLEEAVRDAERLQRTLDDAGEARETLQATQAALGEVALAEFLAEQQRALAADPGTTSAAEQRLSEGVAEFLSGLSEPLPNVGGSELLSAAQSQRERAREAVTSALAAMDRATSELAAEESGARSESGSEREASASTGSAGEQSEAGQAGEPGDSGEAGQAGESSDSGEPGQVGEAGENSAGSSGEQPAGSTPQEAADGSPAEQQDSERPAREAMDEATAQLERARDALIESERTLAAARNRARAMSSASARQAQRQAEELKQDALRLEAIEPEQGPDLLDRTRDLMDELAAMQESLEDNQLSQAGQQGAAAEMSLNDILKHLQQRRQGANDQPREPQTPEQLANSVAQQQELQRRLRELMDRLEELPDQEFQQPGERAESAMQQAAQALQEGRDQEAATRQEEASEALEEAKQKLQGERDRYEQLRQEEVLFRLGEELKGLLDEQLAVSSETREVNEARGDRERLSRSHRRAVARLSETERSLAREASAIAEELSADGAKVFVFAIEQVADGMQSAADELADQETGSFVASLQQGIEQRLADLLAVLDDELERRREAMQDMADEEPPPDQGAQGRQPLVPPVAELLLIQRMELMALTRIENFQDLHPEAAEEGLGEMELMLLERWALEHSKTTALFESMIPEDPEVEVDAEHLPIDAGGTDPDDPDNSDDGEERR